MLFFVQTASGFCVLRDLVLFLIRTVSVFSLLRRLGCVHLHEVRCADVICVGMSSLIWWGTSGCLVMFLEITPRNHIHICHWGQAASVIRRLRDMRCCLYTCIDIDYSVSL